MRRVVRAFLCAIVPLAAAVVPAAARAQDEACPGFGAARFAPSVTSSRLGVDTNVFRAAEPQGDFVVSAAPRVDACLPLWWGARLQAAAAAGVDYYARFAGERSLNPAGTARLDVPAGRLRFFAGIGRLRTRRPPRFEIDLRAARAEDEAFAGVGVELSPLLSLDLDARRNRVRFDAHAFFAGASLSEALDRDERAGAATLRWRRTVLSTFTFDTQVRDARFRRSSARDARDVVARLGADFHPLALVSGSGRVGVRRFEAGAPSVPDFSGLTACADLSYRPSAGDAMITFTAERDLQYSFSAAEPYYVVGFYGLDVRRRVGRVGLRLGFGGEFYDYARRRAGAAPAAGSESVRWTTVVSVRRGLETARTVGFDLRYFRWDGNVRADQRYGGVEAGLVLGYGVPPAGLPERRVRRSPWERNETRLRLSALRGFSRCDAAHGGGVR